MYVVEASSVEKSSANHQNSDSSYIKASVAANKCLNDRTRKSSIHLKFSKNEILRVKMKKIRRYKIEYKISS